jgi:uncharacterized membrane protein
VSTQPEEIAERIAARRERFRGAVSRLSSRAQSTELLRMLLVPGAFLLIAGFVLMFLGWYGAAHTPRQIEQIPYLISGGFIGLGLVFLGALILASALWMSMLQRFSEQSDERVQRARPGETTHEEPPAPRRRTRSGRTRP